MQDQTLMQEMKRQVEACERCGLHRTRRHTVFGAGAHRPIVFFIGEAPGQAEDARGVPFVGPAGALFGRILDAAEIDRDHIFVTNILKCRPPGNRNPNPDEVAACSRWLAAQIALAKPTLVVTLGRPASNHLLATDAPIGSLRGRWRQHDGLWVMPTYHPAALLRNASLKPKTWADFQMIRERYRAALATQKGH